MFAAAIVALAPRATAGDGLRTVLLSGDAAPGVAGAEMAFFGAPVLSGGGRVAFAADVRGAGIDSENESGLWLESPGGALNLVAREGDQTPDAPAGVLYGDLNTGAQRVMISDSGVFAFEAALVGSAVTAPRDLGVYRAAPGGTVSLLAREGVGSPVAPAGTQFGRLLLQEIAADGRVAFSEGVSGPGVDSVFGNWSVGDGGAELFVRFGEQAPGLAPGVNYLGFDALTINNDGARAYVGIARDANVGPIAFGVWSETAPGVFAPAAVADEPAPGAGPDARFTAFGGLAIVDGGETIFGGRAVDDAGTGRNGVWSIVGGAIAPVFVGGQPAPGAGAGATFENPDFFAPIATTSGGTVAFATPAVDAAGQNARDGVWVAEPGAAPRLVALVGETLPGLPAGATLTDIDAPTINEHGRVAFRATYAAPGAPSGGGGGVWAEDPGGVLRLVVAEGQWLDVDADPQVEDLRRVASLGFDGRWTGVGGGGGFNDRGELAFAAFFDDGTAGLFVQDTAALIPEPTAVTLLLATLAATRVGRRR